MRWTQLCTGSPAVDPIASKTSTHGLGLSITKGFIEAMGGTIVAASPIHGDKGTRMLIGLNKSPDDVWKAK